jgi:hypothetical protein
VTANAHAVSQLLPASRIPPGRLPVPSQPEKLRHNRFAIPTASFNSRSMTSVRAASAMAGDTPGFSAIACRETSISATVTTG